MRQVLALATVVCVSACFVPAASATTSLPSRAEDTRIVQVVREYQIPATKGQKTVAAIPALMSFWGATNQQVVTQSEFTYSIKPDKIEVTADHFNMPRRNYELTWNSPGAETINVTQKLTVRLACCCTLATGAKLPYPKPVKERFAKLLAKDDEINPDNPEVATICKEILSKAVYAEDAVELVCDWMNNNIPFKTQMRGPSDKILADRFGNCEGQSNVVCAMLRHMGIPAERVQCLELGGAAHDFIEVYFPDAGWVFYDPTIWDRGYKRLNCLLTVGWCFRTGDGGKESDWHVGIFCTTKDAAPYSDPVAGIVLRPTPNGRALGVRVIHQKTPDSIRVRHEALSDLIMDLSVPPGKRDYTKEVSPLAPAPVVKPSAAAKSNIPATSATSAAAANQ